MLANLLFAGETLEATMLICFGLSWPISIVKSWRMKFVRGKSVGFLLLVFFGYLAGTAAKFSRAAFLGQPPEWNTTLYILNAILVAVDIVLYIRYRHNPYPACVV